MSNARLAAAIGTLALASFAFGCKDDVPRYSGEGFTTDPPRPGPMNGTIVTTNSGDDTLSVFEPQTLQVRWKIPVGFVPVQLEGPHHVVAEPTGKFFFVNLSLAVAGSGSGPHGTHGTGTIPGYLLKISTTDGSLAASAVVDTNPGDCVLSKDAATIYVTHYDLAKWIHASHGDDPRLGDSNLVAVDTASMTIKKRVPLCPAAHGAQVSNDGTTLYSSCGPDMIAVVDLRDPVLPVKRVLLPGGVEMPGCAQCPYAIGVAPDGLVWVSTLGMNAGNAGGGVRLYDPTLPPEAGFDAARAVKLCGSAMFSTFAADATVAGGYRAYVPEQGACGDWLRIFTPGAPGQPPVADGAIMLPSTQCLNAHAVMISDDRRLAFLVCEGDHVGPGSLVTIDLQTQTVKASTPIGVFADGLARIPSP